MSDIEAKRAEIRRYIDFTGIKPTDRFTPVPFYGGSNDGIVRTADGRIIADTQGNEVLTEFIAAVLNLYMDENEEIDRP